MINWRNIESFLGKHYSLRPWEIDKMHLGQIFSHVNWAFMEERKNYQLNAPSMGGKDSGKKWRRKVVEPQMDNLWNLLFPMTKHGKTEIQKKRKRNAKVRRRKIKEVRNNLNA